jgi:hypothetical protein
MCDTRNAPMGWRIWLLGNIEGRGLTTLEPTGSMSPSTCPCVAIMYANYAAPSS